MNCPEKKKFNSRAAAISHLRNVQGRKRNHINQYPYLCTGPDGCHYWHLTTEFDHTNKALKLSSRL